MRLFSQIGCVALSVLLVAPAVMQAQGNNDAAIRAEVQRTLRNKKFSGVQVQVSDGVVTLGGNVERYADKEDAAHKAEHQKDVHSVNNRIEVAAAQGVSDGELWQKLAKGLTYVGEGYNTTAFDSFDVTVRDGVVTVSGTAVNPVDKDAALSLVSNTAGVRDVIDHVQIAPVSPMDERIRFAETRAIYGFEALNKYALNPAKPIRITVVNGHVTLSGVVDNDGDRNLAYVRANGVPGVFSVTNDLQVQGEHPEH